MNPIYFECHVTIEPVEGERLNKFTELCEKWDFKVAKLLMQKTLDPSKLDSFCTCKRRNFTEVHNRMNWLLADLEAHVFNVYRYKIEAIIIDHRAKRENLCS